VSFLPFQHPRGRFQLIYNRPQSTTLRGSMSVTHCTGPNKTNSHINVSVCQTTSDLDIWFTLTLSESSLKGKVKVKVIGLGRKKCQAILGWKCLPPPSVTFHHKSRNALQNDNTSLWTPLSNNYCIRWCSGAMGRALDLRSTNRGFKSYSGKKLRNNLGQVVHNYVPLSPSSITWYRPRGGDTLRLGR